MTQRASDIPRREQYRYRNVFFAHNGPGPWPCDFCSEAVDAERFHIHHADGDHANNVPENLKPAHASCHIRHHNAGKTLGPFTDEHRAKLAAAARSRPPRPQSEETRRKIGDAQRGRSRSDETRRKISEARKAQKTEETK